MSLRQKLASDISAAARAKLAEAGSDSGNPYIGLMTKLLTNRVPMDEVNTEIRQGTNEPRQIRQTRANYDMPLTDIATALNPVNIALHNLK